MRFVSYGILALALASCGPNNPGDPATFSGQWTPIAQTSEGGQVQYLPSSRAYDAAAQTTDVTVKILYPDLQVWTKDLPPYQEQTWFQMELVTIRYDCAANTYAIVQRQALDRRGYVRETIKPPAPAKSGFKKIAGGGLAEIVLPRACKAG